MTLSYEEEQFITIVRQELKNYDITPHQMEEMVAQIQEHLEACREHGEMGLQDLDSPIIYVRDYAEVQGFSRVSDPSQSTPAPKDSGERTSTGRLWGFLKHPLIFAAVYVICQLAFSFSLTTAWVNGYEITGFHLLYRISDQTWWNMLLILFSLLISSVITLVAYVYDKRKHRRPFPETEAGSVT
ncbi:hypothetical protein M2277_000564 [Paenibacillus sp. LBL]|uniref:hypothetical protein n=1 Tax=Paenibacillus sp. LBL TaxID=2940563 RepID=UPI00247356A7|nr:hypothetical protein [Paenibacillus sp. LBL]MDH6669920.1 hypothetical protein [Paenibacillus sp. LBL]